MALLLSHALQYEQASPVVMGTQSSSVVQFREYASSEIVVSPVGPLPELVGVVVDSLPHAATSAIGPPTNDSQRMPTSPREHLATRFQNLVSVTSSTKTHPPGPVMAATSTVLIHKPGSIVNTACTRRHVPSMITLPPLVATYPASFDTTA